MQKYMEAQKENLHRGCQSNTFRELVGRLDGVSRMVIAIHDPDTPQIFGRLLLICHKSMLSAASLIAQSQPDDSVAITRRAVEAAKVALAVKLNDNNGQRWVSFQERHDRWLTRQVNEKPKPFHPRFLDLKDDPVVQELDRFLGILSDAYVHFTPEYYSSLDWDKQQKPDGGGEIFLNYFHRDPRETERHLMLLGAIHGVIIKAFNRCLNDCITNNPETLAAVREYWQAAKRINDEYQKTYGVTPYQG